MKTTKDLLNMCVAEFGEQLSKCSSWNTLAMALYAPILAFDYIVRGEYYV